MSERLLRTRRAPTACSWCRHRKVRCDATIHGSPCTRCRQDGRSNCVLRTSFRQYKGSRGQVPLLPRPENEENQPNSICTRGDTIDLQNWVRYPFVDTEFLSALPPEDIAFLTSKCSHTLPDEDAIDEFVRQYFTRMHPIIPVVDEAQFWRIYQGDAGVGKLSLFLLQAILFASCVFVSLDTLRRCGFSDKRDARKHLHDRAKLLFDLKAETRPWVKAQGSVLLTHQTSAEEPQAGSIWLMRAIESARLIDAQPCYLVENVKKPLKKRLWWSILLRDRSLCIGLRRRPQVHVDYWEWMAEEDFEDEILHSQVYDESTKRQLFQVFQEQCRLAVLLSDLVSLVFVPRTTPSCFMSVAEFEGLISTIERINRSLTDWETQTPFPPPMPSESTDLDDPVAILTNLTFMYLHTARVDLAQYAAFMTVGNPSLSRETYHQRKLKIGKNLKHGIEGLTLAMEYFSVHGHLESIPLSVLAYVGMPLILAALDLKLSSSYEEMMARKRRLNSLSVIIRHSYSLYDVTDYVAVGINHILQLAYLTTRNIFLHCPNSYEIESSKPGHSGSLRRHGHRNPQTPGRATSWVHGFVHCPQAYLLISTSVDYSLAVGRLPHVNALPELVRNIPAMGAVFTLPWTISNHPVTKGVERSFLPPVSGSSSSSDQPRVRPVSPELDELTQQWKSGDRMVHSIVNALRDNDESASQEDPEEDPGGNGTMVNLNYMDLGRLDGSPSSKENNTMGEVLSSKDGLDRVSDQNDLFTETAFDSDFLGLLEEG